MNNFAIILNLTRNHFLRIVRPMVLKRLLTEDVTQLELGIDWNSVDFNDPVMLEKALKELFKSLSK